MGGGDSRAGGRTASWLKVGVHMGCPDNTREGPRHLGTRHDVTSPSLRVDPRHGLTPRVKERGEPNLLAGGHHGLGTVVWQHGAGPDRCGCHLGARHRLRLRHAGSNCRLHPDKQPVERPHRQPAGGLRADSATGVSSFPKQTTAVPITLQEVNPAAPFSRTGGRRLQRPPSHPRPGARALAGERGGSARPKHGRARPRGPPAPVPASRIDSPMLRRWPSRAAPGAGSSPRCSWAARRGTRWTWAACSR